jgi:hypothetical protein
VSSDRLARIEENVEKLEPERPVVFVHVQTTPPPGMTWQEEAAWCDEQDDIAARAGKPVFRLRIPQGRPATDEQVNEEMSSE